MEDTTGTLHFSKVQGKETLPRLPAQTTHVYGAPILPEGWGGQWASVLDRVLLSAVGRAGVGWKWNLQSKSPKVTNLDKCDFPFLLYSLISS